MTEGTIEFRIVRPREAVFALLVDLERAPDWAPAGLSVEKLDPGPPRAGTRYRLRGRMALRVHEARLEVVELERPRLLVHRGSAGSLRFEASFELVEDDGGTLVTHRYALRAGGLGRFLLPLGSRQVRHGVEGVVEALRRALEEGA